MTYHRDQFRHDLRELRMSQQQLASRLELSPATVYHWGMGREVFPTWLPLLLAAWVDNRRQAQQIANLQDSVRHVARSLGASA